MPAVRVTMEIFGLSRGGALLVERALAHVVGVQQVYVNSGTEMAYLEYDPSACDERDLIHAVEQAGYTAGLPQRR